MERTQHLLVWKVGHTDHPDVLPDRLVPAKVPGAVQLDWARAEGWEDHNYGRNYEAYGWMEDRYWIYSTVLDSKVAASGKRQYFVCKGVDYQFLVRLDGKELHRQEGMFTPFELDLTDLIAPRSVLEIVVFPAPKRVGAPRGRSEADQSCKPAVSYGWDWHPRLIPLGIWDEAYMEVRSEVHIRQAEVSSKLERKTNSCDEAAVQLDVMLSAAAGVLEWRIYDKNDKLVEEQVSIVSSKEIRMSANLAAPDLWWPNGYGEAALYTSELMLYSDAGVRLDLQRSRFGIRTVTLEMHEGAWDEPSRFPKSRSHPPITLVVNGLRLFAKGTNWVNPDIFPGTLNRERYAKLLGMAADAHMNLIRVWGGGPVNKDAFFDECDEKGLMVWQEFPLACNNYEGTPSYLEVLDRESSSIIRRLRSRACLVLWCGGNELFNVWSGMTDQSLALRLLNRNSYDLDPHRPFLMTSPVMGMGHGHYLFRDPSTGEEVFQTMPNANCTAYTEFGIPSPANVGVLERYIPRSELFPPARGGSWEAHHAYGAWEEDTWLCEETIREYFGPHTTIEELVERGQWLQSEGYKCIYEEARRQKPVCSMALNWCFNEAWPAAANNSLICWPDEPKPALFAVKQSCRPVLASARIPKFRWIAGEEFESELWLLNDAPYSVKSGRMTAHLIIGSMRFELLIWLFPELPPSRNAPGPTVRFRLPPMEAWGSMRLVLQVEGRQEWDSEYTMLCGPAQTLARSGNMLNR